MVERPHLGDLTRDGQDNEAAKELANVANTLHATTPNTPKHNHQRAQTLAAHLLITQTDICPCTATSTTTTSASPHAAT
jgi:hypothetical protein